MTTIKAGNLTREHLMQYVSLTDKKRYAGTLRHFGHFLDGVSVFITSSDNAVIIGSLTLHPDHEITLTGGVK